tara:strand:+ start:416 stop:793 length:378 start_codon:yes stop_codon:yes gene_type:complete
LFIKVTTTNTIINTRFIRKNTTRNVIKNVTENASTTTTKIPFENQRLCSIDRRLQTMIDLKLIRSLLDRKNEALDDAKDNLAEAYVFLDRLEQEDYVDEEEQENFEDDLKSILNELQIDVDNYEE